MKTREILIASMFFVWGFSKEVRLQGVTIGSNNPPHPAAGLELDFNNKGFLWSRLTTTQRDAISNPPASLTIYNTDTDCLEMFFASGGWKPIQCGCTAFPNAVFSIPSASTNNPVTFSAPAPNMSYAWTFQNGNPATASTQVVQVTWSSVGKYGVTLTATDSAGCSSTHTDSVIVSSCQPFSHTFTNCGQTGRSGPSQGQCDAIYGSGVVTVNGGKQSWVVPSTGTYRIEAAGAQGGGSVGGKGAILAGNFSLSAGDVIVILVGQQGQNYSGNRNMSGGGGTYVYNNTTGQILVIAGGGGGAPGSYASANGSTAQNGNNGEYGSSGIDGVGGTGGNGGGGSSCRGGGGGGWSGMGAIVGCGGSAGEGGMSFLSGGLGGNISGEGVVGGFGGGGSSEGTNSAWTYAGGGGGYSGGGGSSHSDQTARGGGGGSYILSVATNVATSNGLIYGTSNMNGPVQNLNNYNSGHGYVTITKVCQ